MKGRNVAFIETPPHLLPPSSQLSPLQDMMPLSLDLDGDTLDNDYISSDDLMQDVTDYTGVLDFTADIPANRENASGVSADPQVQGLINQIRDLTTRDLLTPAVPLPGAASLTEPLPAAAEGTSSGGASPSSGGGVSLKTGGPSPAPMPATTSRGGVMRNRITRPNVATRRLAAEPTGTVTGTEEYTPITTTTTRPWRKFSS